MSAYNPNYVPPAHAPMPLNGNNMVNGLPGGVQQQQQQPGPPTGQPYLPQKQPQQFQQPPPAAAYPGAGAPGNLPPPPQFNSGIASQFLPPTSGAAPSVQQQLPPSTLPPHMRPPTVNGPPLTNGSNGASSANSSRTASPRPMGTAPQYAHGPIAAALNNPPPASGLRPSPQPASQSLANLTNNLENLNFAPNCNWVTTHFDPPSSDR